MNVTFTPTDTTDYTTATQERDADRQPGHADDHLGRAGRHHLRHRAERDPARRHGRRPGTFAYTPAAGTVLTAGTQTLTVTFTPTDTTDYTTASKSVTLTVNSRRRRP